MSSMPIVKCGGNGARAQNSDAIPAYLSSYKSQSVELFPHYGVIDLCNFCKYGQPQSTLNELIDYYTWAYSDNSIALAGQPTVGLVSSAEYVLKRIFNP